MHRKRINILKFHIHLVKISNVIELIDISTHINFMELIKYTLSCYGN